MMNPKYKKIFEPIQIGHMLVKNRIESAPAAPRLASKDGLVTPELIEWTRKLAKGGAGIVTVGISRVNPLAWLPSAFCLNMGSDIVVSGLGALVDSVHRYGAKASIELGDFFFGNDLSPGKSIIDVMTEEEIKQWIGYFADAAERASKAGMDMVLLHGGHGILISNFFSPLFNHRTDTYGGSTENRARFACELLDAVRDRVGRELAIEFRISAEELAPGGVELKESIEFVKIIEDRIDLLHVSAGMLMVEELTPVITQPAYLERGYNTHYAGKIKRAGIKVPITTVGSIDLDLAAEVLEKGEADMCAMIRTLIADPESVNKARTGKEDEIRPCIRCALCIDRTHDIRCMKRVACSVNPRAGRELEFRDAAETVHKKKRVMVIGGGPAGMEAARAAADRGHDVTLFEKSEKLGGALNMAVSPDFKADLKSYLKWSIRMTTRHPGIKIRLATEATPELVKHEAPDALVIAVGGEASMPEISGLDNVNVVWVGDVEAGSVQVGNKVIVAGGALAGCETALDLARKGKKVTIVEMISEEEMLKVSPIPMTAMKRLLKEAGVTIMASHELIGVGDTTASVEGPDGRKDLNFDTLITSLGVKPRTEEMAKFTGLVDEVFCIGDCVITRGTVYTATTGGFNAGMDI